MTKAIPGQLQVAVETAISQGMTFLQEEVTAEGAWPSAKHSFDAKPENEYSAFVAASGVLVLEACRDQRADELRARSKRFLVSYILPHGLWSYIPGLHPDLDDTSVCSMAVGPAGHSALFMGRNLAPVLANRDEEGRFLTWLRPKGMPNDADSVVNANVISWLGDRPETSAAQRWIERLIRENRESGSSRWYVPVMDLYYCVSRASKLAAPAFANLRSELVNRILNTKTSNTLQNAQRLSALEYLGEGIEPDGLKQWIEELIDTQGSDGSWRSCEIWRGPAELGYVFWSKSLTTAYCIEALSRVVSQLKSE